MGLNPLFQQLRTLLLRSDKNYTPKELADHFKVSSQSFSALAPKIRKDNFMKDRVIWNKPKDDSPLGR